MRRLGNIQINIIDRIVKKKLLKNSDILIKLIMRFCSKNRSGT